MNIINEEAKFILERLSEEELFLLREVNKVQVKGFSSNNKKMKPAVKTMFEKNLRTVLQNSNDLNKKIEKYIDSLNAQKSLPIQWTEDTSLKDILKNLENKNFNEEKLKREQNYILYSLYFLDNEDLKLEFLEFLGFYKCNNENIEKIQDSTSNNNKEDEETIKFLRNSVKDLTNRNDKIKKSLDSKTEEAQEKQKNIDDLNKKYNELAEKNVKLNKYNKDLKEKSLNISKFEATIQNLKEVISKDDFPLLDLKIYASEELINYIKQELNTKLISINEMENADLIFFYDTDYSNRERQDILESLKENNREVIILKKFQDIQNWISQLGGVKWKFYNQKNQILDILGN